MECKKIKLFEATQSKVYSDEYGFVDSRVGYEIIAKIKRNGRTIQYEYNRAYKKSENGQYTEITVNDLKNIFDLELYANDSWPYGRYIKINKIIEVAIFWGGDKKIQAKESIKEQLDVLLNTEVYEVYDYKKETLLPYEIKEGLPVIYQGRTWKVEELFHTPNVENKLCKIVSWKNDQSAYISCGFQLIDEAGRSVNTSGDHKFYKLPYYKYSAPENELERFNEEIRENELAPYLVYGNDRGALFWQPLEDASRYIVSVYKYRSDRSVKKKLYLLEKNIIERNKCWFRIDEIIGAKYILRLEAENRDGEIIGKSRGIAIKFENNTTDHETLPGYWDPKAIK